MRRPPGIEAAGRPGGCRADLRNRFPPSAQASIVRKISYRQAYGAKRPEVFHSSLFAAQQYLCAASTALCQQQITTFANRELRHFSEALQQPGQHHLESDMIFGHIDLAR